VDVSPHDIEAETSEAEVGMAAAVVRVPYAQVLTIESTSRATREGFGMTLCENCPPVDKDILVGNFGVQRTVWRDLL
jgi:hypothetical protein